MKKNTVTVLSLVVGQVLLSQAKVTKEGKKAYCEFAEIIQNEENGPNLLALANKGDERFNSTSKPRRAWISFEPTQYEAMTGLKFADLKEEFTEINLLNPELEGNKIKLYVKETLEPNEYQAANIEKTAKQTVNRKTSEVMYFYSKGRFIFSNVIAEIEGNRNAVHERINVKAGIGQTQDSTNGLFPFNHIFPKMVSLVKEAKEAFEMAE